MAAPGNAGLPSPAMVSKQPFSCRATERP